jgi:hypothetical protein
MNGEVPLRDQEVKQKVTLLYGLSEVWVKLGLRGSRLYLQTSARRTERYPKNAWQHGTKKVTSFNCNHDLPPGCSPRWSPSP